MCDLPRPGIKPTSPALAGGFFAADPPGKPCSSFLKSSWWGSQIMFFNLFYLFELANNSQPRTIASNQQGFNPYWSPWYHLKSGCGVHVAQTVKSLFAMQEIWVWSLGREDPLQKETGTHSSIVAWRIPWTEEPGRVQSVGSHRVRHDCSNLAHMHTEITSSF